MNKPTIFGATGNTLLGGGEAGAEAILPLSKNVLADIGAGIVAATETSNSGLLNSIDSLSEKVMVLQRAIENMGLYLDGDKLVGGIAPKMNSTFQSMNRLNGRGVAAR